MESTTETAQNETTASSSSSSTTQPPPPSSSNNNTDTPLPQPLQHLRNHIAALQHENTATRTLIWESLTGTSQYDFHVPTLQQFLSNRTFALDCLATLEFHATTLLRDPSPANIEAARRALHEPLAAPPVLNLAQLTATTFDEVPSGLAVEATLSRALQHLPAGAVSREEMEDEVLTLQWHRRNEVPERPIGWNRAHDEFLRQRGAMCEGPQMVEMLRAQHGMCVSEMWVDRRLLQIRMEPPRGWSDRHDAVLSWFWYRNPPKPEDVEDEDNAWLWTAAAYVSNNTRFTPVSIYYVRQRMEELEL